MKKLFVYFIVIIGGACFLYYQNNEIVVTRIDLKLDNLSKEFDGLRILQLSDLHSKVFGRNQQELADKIKKAKPDIIFMTGDMIDSRHYKEEPVLELVDEIRGIAPVYYVTGNHEISTGIFDSLAKKLEDRGVKVLRNTKSDFEWKGKKLEIIGVDDPVGNISSREFLSKEIQEVLDKGGNQDFKILLSHRPEYIQVYAGYNMDLVFSGHAHGGQVRLPFIGGLFAPGQGWLPEYTSGEYKAGNSVMIVNRGLGNSIIPQRLFNRPEIIVVSLRKK